MEPTRKRQKTAGAVAPAEQVAVHHEFIGFDAFGLDTPEMSHFTGFN